MIDNMRNARRLWPVSILVVGVSLLACGRSPSLTAPSSSLPECYGDVVRGPCRYVPPPQPLIIVDGQPWKKWRKSHGADIDPSQIYTIIVLPGPEAVARYGKAARDGALLIALKH